MVRLPIVGQVLHIIEASRSHSVGLLWTSDQPVAETSSRQHTTFLSDRHPYLRGDSNPQSQQVSGRRPTSYTARALGSAGISCRLPSKKNLPEQILNCAVSCWKGSRVCLTAWVLFKKHVALQWCNVLVISATCQDVQVCCWMYSRRRVHSRAQLWWWNRHKTNCSEMLSTLGARNIRGDTDTCEFVLRFSRRRPLDTGVLRCCSSVSIRQEVEYLRHLWMPEDRSASSQWISRTVSVGTRAVEKVTRYCMRIETVPSEGRGQTSWRWTGSIPLHVERTLLPGARCLTPAVRGTTRCGWFELLIPCVFCRWLADRKLMVAGRTASDIRLTFLQDITLRVPCERISVHPSHANTGMDKEISRTVRT